MSDNTKKLFLLDAYALIFRAYYAFIKNPRINSKGLNTSAIFGFTNTLLEVLKKQEPSHIAVVFDPPGGTTRVDDYAAYKANREETPEDIKLAVPYIMEIIRAFNIPILMADGYEADDVIGTLAKKAEKEGFITYMMTPDKDFAQLVSSNIFMYKPGRGGKPAEVWGTKEVCEKFEVKDPIQVIDILGLWGDSVDNIPGIPGIGEKTAKKLVAAYGSVEGLIAHTDELKGKQKENVINFAEQGLLSKKLATIMLDAPVEFKPAELIVEEPNKEKIIELFSELEFRTMAQRVFGVKIQSSNGQEGQLDIFGQQEIADEAAEEKTFKTIDDFPVEYKLVQSEQEISDLIDVLNKAKEFAFDTETTNIDEHLAEIVGISFSVEKHKAFYLPFSEDFESSKNSLGRFKDVFADTNKTAIAHNIKYDATILKKYGIQILNKTFDTMLAHYLIYPDMKHNMDILAQTYFNYETISIETLIGKKGKKQLNMRDVAPEKVTPYACEDADITLQFKLFFDREIEKEPLNRIFHEMEMPLTNVLSDMEAEGINLDVLALKTFSEELNSDLISYQEAIYKFAGEEFNIDSPRQLGEILFDKMKISTKAKKTKTGQYATGEEVLQKMASKHDIIPTILDYRAVRKLKSTYVDTLPKLIHPEDKRIHTSYMQAVAATGRLSSNNPNLQNIPIRTERGREIRKAFIPRDENHILMAADYSQIELRIIAALSEDENMINDFKEGLDIHSTTASRVFKVDLEEVSRDQRSSAKVVNFGIIYGISAFGLSERIGISRKEAKQLIDNYFETYPTIKKYMDDNIQIAREKGYVETLFGRRRVLKDINSQNAIVRGHAERNAINAPIQGSAADIIKLAMIKVADDIQSAGLQSKMLLQVHDELVFDVPKNEVEQMTELVKNGMEKVVDLSVPLDVEVGTGKNWLEAH